MDFLSTYDSSQRSYQLALFQFSLSTLLTSKDAFSALWASSPFQRSLSKHTDSLSLFFFLWPSVPLFTDSMLTRRIAPLFLVFGSSYCIEIKSPRKLLRISSLEHETISWVESKTNFLVGPQASLLVTFKRWEIAWFGCVTRHDSLSKTTRQGTLEGG